ncbi:MAG: HAD family hydrolase [Sulfolobales archaeon]
MRIKVLSFDVWNTLLDIDKFYKILAIKISSLTNRSYEEIYSLLRDTYREAIRERLSGEFKRIIIDSGSFFAKRLGIDLEVLFKSLIRVMLDEEIRDLAYRDVLKPLEILKNDRYLLSVVGNVMFWPGMVTRYILHLNNLLDLFDLTVFSDETGYMKPEREIFKYIAERLGVRLDEIVHIGDSIEHDLVGAVRSGLGAILVRRDLDVPIIKLGRRIYIINSFDYLEKVVKEIELS